MKKKVDGRIGRIESFGVPKGGGGVVMVKAKKGFSVQREPVQMIATATVNKCAVCGTKFTLGWVSGDRLCAFDQKFCPSCGAKNEGWGCV